MKCKSIDNFFIGLSNNDFDSLEEIIIDKYFELRDLYFIIKEYDSWFNNINYNNGKKLSITLDIVSDVNKEDFIDIIFNRVRSDKFKCNLCENNSICIVLEK